MNSLLRLTLSALCASACNYLFCSSVPASESISLEVRETAGIRRFGYPVAAELRLDPPVPAGTKFRLVHDGKPIAAQFRPIEMAGDRIASVALDFDGNFIPRESREYVVEYGHDVSAGPEPDRGMKVEETAESFVVSHGPNLSWVVPEKLLGLIRSVKTPKWDYLRPDSEGLFVHGRNNGLFRIGGPGTDGVQMAGRIVKQGPIDCTIRFASTEASRRNRDFSTSVELEFPRSKSWVRVTWTVDDPKALVTGLTADLNLNVTGEPTLVDFGASTLVYATLARGQAASMSAGVPPGHGPVAAGFPTPTWQVVRGPAGKMERYVDGPPDRPDLLPEGWAHVMDRERCTAVAVDQFARRGRDRLDIDAAGRLKIRRDFTYEAIAPAPGRKQLNFWLHFVPFPPHVGAVTSPQSMQAPLQVKWKPGHEGRRAAGQKSNGNQHDSNNDNLDKQIDSLKARAQAALAKTSGELRLAGLNDKVEVLRDKWGVPHIYAQNPDDLFFAQGFVQAQDRLWQLELWRRTTEGKLAEIIGPEAVERDRFARLVRYRGDRDAEWTSYSPDARQIIESFVRGVNAFIELSRDNPPIEFELTGIKPEPWTPQVCIGRMAGFIMCRNASNEILRAQLVRELGAEQAAKLLPIDPSHELVVPDGLDLDGIDQRIVAGINSVNAAVRVPLADDPRPNAVPRSERGEAKRHRHRAMSPLTTHDSPLTSDIGFGDTTWAASGFTTTHDSPLTSDIGSNNWTIAGRLTATGKPILASDPHRPVTLPSLRYLVHLNCPPTDGGKTSTRNSPLTTHHSPTRGWNVIGGTEPALPGVALGHNDHIAWGMTIVGTDQTDIYVEDTHPDDPNRYRVGDDWQPMRIEREQIRVRGEAEPREFELKFTRHGPVLFEDRQRHRAYALRWTGSEPGTAGYLAALSVDHAENWREFLEAADRWKIPGLNLVYADRDGHIGWIAAALTPVRRGWDGLLPVPGAAGKFEWDGFLPTAELPQRFDPPEGYVATANHNILPRGYRHQISYEWAAPFRFGRVDEVLGRQIQSGRKFSLGDSQNLQHDATSIPARRLLAVLRGMTVDDPALRPTVELLLRWDGVLARDSSAAALYAVWQSKLAERVLKPRVPEKLWTSYSGRLPLQVALDLIEHPDSAFGPDPRAGRDALLIATLRDAVSDLQKRLGPDPADWRWGKLHQARPKHMLAAEKAESGGRKAEGQKEEAASRTLRVESQREQASDRSAIAVVFNLPPVPRGGDGNTPFATGVPGHGNFDQTTGASYRHVMDLADWDRSVATSAPGQSGQPGSPHYGDLLPLWAEGKYFPLPFTRAAVEAATSDRLTLLPKR